MPYYGRRRRRTFRRRRYKKSSRPNYTTIGAAKFLAKRAYQGVRYLKGLVNSEMFKFDNSFNSTVSTSPGSLNLVGIGQGDDENQRQGNSILARYLHLRFDITIHASATNTFLRMVLVCDKQQTADTSPTFSDIFDTSTVSAVIGPLNKNTVGRYSIMFDRVFKLDNQAHPNIFKKMYFKLYRHVRYNGTATTDVQKNGMWLFYVSNEATNTPTLTLQSRIGYHDN